MYGVLAFLALRAAVPARPLRRAVAAVLVGASAFGSADEWHQQFVPGRSQDGADWLADTLGAASGITLALALRPRREPIA